MSQTSSVIPVSLSFWGSFILFVASLSLHFIFPGYCRLAGGMPLAGFIALLSGIWLSATILMIATIWFLRRKGHPISEGLMIGRLYRLLSIMVMILAVAYGFGKLGTFGTLFSLFGGMILGGRYRHRSAEWRLGYLFPSSDLFARVIVFSIPVWG